MAADQQQEKSQQHTSRGLEWLAMSISMLLILSAAGYLAYQGWQPEQPAAFDIQTGPVRQIEGRYYLPLEVFNTGTQSAQGLVLEVRLVERKGGPAVEMSMVHLQWVPGKSSRRAVAGFRHDPAQYRVQTDVQGYEEP